FRYFSMLLWRDSHVDKHMLALCMIVMWRKTINFLFFLINMRRRPRAPLFPYTPLFRSGPEGGEAGGEIVAAGTPERVAGGDDLRSEEHTSGLQSRFDVVCRLLHEKKKKTTTGTLRRLRHTHRYQSRTETHSIPSYNTYS